MSVGRAGFHGAGRKAWGSWDSGHGPVSTPSSIWAPSPLPWGRFAPLHIGCGGWAVWEQSGRRGSRMPQQLQLCNFHGPCPALSGCPPPGGVMLPPSNTDLRAFGCKTRPVQLPLSANPQDLAADKGDGSLCPLLPVCQPEWDLAKLDEKAQSLPGWTPRSDALCGILPGAPG